MKKLKKLTVKQLQQWVHNQQRQHRRRGHFSAGRIKINANDAQTFENTFGLGEGRSTVPKLTLAEAQAFCKLKGLDSGPKYRAFLNSNKNTGLPSAPYKYYGIRWREFFGKPAFLTFEKAQAFCKRKGLDTISKYLAFFKKNKNTGLPSAPYRCYGIRWREFFGKPAFLTFEKAQAFCKRKGLDTQLKYQAFSKKNKNTGLPSAPYKYYGIRWREFFGKPAFLTFEKAQAFCKRKGLDTISKYLAFFKKNKNTGLPYNPSRSYGVGWNEFFGKKPLARRAA